MTMRLAIKVLVTGSRDLKNHQVVYDALDRIWEQGEPMLVIHGDARGADHFADIWAEFRTNVTVVRVPADWKNDGRAAGPIRNTRMLALEPHLVLAFFQDGSKNSGTSDMVSKAISRNLPVTRYIVPAEVPDE